MKKIGIAFALLVVLASCSKSEIGNPQTPATPDLSAPIILSAGIEANAQAKVAIDGTAFPVDKDDVFRLTAYAGADVPSDWTTPYFADQQVNSGALSLISLNTAQYYPVDGSHKLYFYAYAPAATSMTEGTLLANPIANYTITGQQDIMAAQITTGIAKVSSGTQLQPELTFEHKLKQVKFVVKRDNSFEQGIKVTSIKVMGQKTSAKLAVGTGVLAFEDITGDLTAYVDDTGIDIVDAGAEIPGSIMFEPGKTFTLDVIAGGVTYRNIAVTLAGTNAGDKGVSHTVTLTFKRGEVVLTASISAWIQGEANNTDVK